MSERSVQGGGQAVHTSTIRKAMEMWSKLMSVSRLSEEAESREKKSKRGARYLSSKKKKQRQAKLPGRQKTKRRSERARQPEDATDVARYTQVDM